MPAITVDDVLVLPAIPPPDRVVAVERPLRSVTTAPRGFEGEGFPVRRAFAGVDLADLDPFIHMDEMGEIEWQPGAAKGTAWHPHRGFETVTYMLDGTFQHQDSHGGGGLISDGDTQWMTAGGGILHIEAPPVEVVAAGGIFHGMQLWVNLPGRLKMTAPRYQDIRGHEVALLTTHDGGALVRVIAGEVAGHAGPGSTHSPITLVHATVEPGAELRLPWRTDFNALAYVMAGRGAVGEGRVAIHSGQLAVLGAGDVVGLRAAATQEASAPALEVLVLGGLPIREPVAAYGPFVMNTREELQQAFDDFNAGRLGRVPAEANPDQPPPSQPPTRAS
jgi:redox-sensitive bicupin YhaK (pirin superfamily)